jgi:hypothetical protein
MKAVEKKAMATSARSNNPFFQQESNHNFFSAKTASTPFFTAKHTTRPAVQRKCAACAQEENMVQRQEQPESPETKPVSPDNTESVAPVPFNKKPRAANCSSDPKFPNLGCYGQQLKLDIDENLLNNAHQFSRVATLFPGDNKLMLDTFLRYGIGKNLLETSFGFAGVNKKWGSILSYGTGIALKSYGVLKDGNLKLDIQVPMGKGVNLDVKFDYTKNPENPGEEKGINTVIGVSGSW